MVKHAADISKRKSSLEPFLFLSYIRRLTTAAVVVVATALK